MNKNFQRLAALILLLALSSCLPSYAQGGRCPANGQPLPTAAERQFTPPIKLLRCFLTAAEINLVRSSIDHNAQTTVNDPAVRERGTESGRIGAPASERRADRGLTAMHAILDDDMRPGAVIRKYIPNSDVGGFLYGRTVIGSPDSPIVVSTNTVRGFVGLERNTQGLDAGETVGALGLDFETGESGQFTDDSPIPFRRQVAREVLRNGLHSIRHRMSTQGANDARIPLAKDLNDAVEDTEPSLDDRSFEMNRQGQENPYTGLGISDNIGLLTLSSRDAADATYPLVLNEEDVMTTPTPLAHGDQLLRRGVNGKEILVAKYIKITNRDGSVTAHWRLSKDLSPADLAYYVGLIEAGSGAGCRRGRLMPLTRRETPDGPVWVRPPFRPEDYAAPAEAVRLFEAGGETSRARRLSSLCATRLSATTSRWAARSAVAGRGSCCSKRAASSGWRWRPRPRVSARSCPFLPAGPGSSRAPGTLCVPSRW